MNRLPFRLGWRHRPAPSSAFASAFTSAFTVALAILPSLAGPLVVVGTVTTATLVAAAPGCAATLPYPAAVETSRQAARAVIARAGRETCLRGKLTKALLGLSASCEKAGEHNDLCRFADQAVVVTPMTLAFMDSTSRQLLDLTGGGPDQALGPRTAPAASPDGEDITP